MKIEYGYNFIRIECVESEISDSAITVAADPKFAEFPMIVYCTDTGTLYTGAYDDGTVTLAEYGSGSGGGGGSDIVYVPITIDFTGDTPVVSSDVSADTIKGYFTARKNVYLIDDSGYVYTLKYIQPSGLNTFAYDWFNLLEPEESGEPILYEIIQLAGGSSIAEWQFREYELAQSQ